MMINIKDIKEDQVKKLTIDIGKEHFLDIDAKVSLINRVKGEINLFLEEKVCLQGKVVYTLSLPCSKCNKSFEEQFMVHIKEYYEESDSSKSSVKDIELNSKSIVTFPLTNGEIDLINVIRDYIITSIPIPIVCPICNESENQRR
ncbi:MAG: hypothetical protein DDT40_00155 [candidate division WS2 bacterium]|uniref:DUF177 domain-containing protein n=1 Tax=Psychracetigena formicireducens TaxID=2986056 RepID=A0A9E2BF61_PSYF1|nr:hypothetical protein [Candidatus Psychracetigena formicireducens]MBT9144473.1 hypothetical protein [Candidatus Psychracetigena formicireducens]MBT9149989.1 hypothetical protein [Candidatus Psychracetigena formicireducens]